MISYRHEKICQIGQNMSVPASIEIKITTAINTF
jgi:hypothetical protein